MHTPPLVERILRAYDLPYVDVWAPQKGYRNKSYAVTLADGQMRNLILYKVESGMLARIRNADRISNYLHEQNYPARSTVGKPLVQLRAGAYVQYAGLYHYLPGHTIPWDGYTQDHIKLLGKTMSDVHAALADFPGDILPEVADEYLAIVSRMRDYFANAPVQRALAAKLLLRVEPAVFDQLEQTLIGSKLMPGKQPLHMDFVRSNILFEDVPADNNLKVSVSGILDFEKTAHGHPLYDIARTLAFLLVDCKYKTPEKVRKYFLGSGYIKRGAAVLPGRHMDMLEPLLNVFLFYDFYKFLWHNPYESLPDNEHFMRTAQLLMPRHLIASTLTSITNQK